MARPKLHRLGDLQLQIMKVLWTHREASVAEVLSQVSSNLAYTTIATMLRKMEARGLVAHRTEGRSFIYRAKIDEKAVSRGLSDHLIERVFGGSVVETFQHLLTSREVSREELNDLEKLIAERKRRK